MNEFPNVEAGNMDEEGMQELIEAQLLAFKQFLPGFIKKDEEIEDLFNNDREPSKKDTKEFEKMKEEYLEFESFFKTFDGQYWRGELSVLDFAQFIKEQAGFVGI